MLVTIAPPPAAGAAGELVLIELQGDVEPRVAGESLDSQLLGNLYYVKSGQPILIVGHHLLYGKVVSLEKPLVVLEKQRAADPTAPGRSCPVLQTKAVVRQKLLFKERPKPIVVHLPKKIA